jgi:hypothetical protein
MTESARLKTSVGTEESAQFTALVAAQGVSVSHLLKRLVRKAIAEKPQVQIERLNAAAGSDRAPPRSTPCV